MGGSWAKSKLLAMQSLGTGSDMSLGRWDKNAPIHGVLATVVLEVLVVDWRRVDIRARGIVDAIVVPVVAGADLETRSAFDGREVLGTGFRCGIVAEGMVARVGSCGLCALVAWVMIDVWDVCWKEAAVAQNSGISGTSFGSGGGDEAVLGEDGSMSVDAGVVSSGCLFCFFRLMVFFLRLLDVGPVESWGLPRSFF